MLVRLSIRHWSKASKRTSLINNWQWFPRFCEKTHLLERRTELVVQRRDRKQYTVDALTNTSVMADNKYAIDYDKRGQASCKKCKQKIGKGVLRIAKMTTNFFSDDGGEMKQYFHPKCIFETFVKARATTKIINDTEVLAGYDQVKEEDKREIEQLIDG